MCMHQKNKSIYSESVPFIKQFPFFNSVFGIKAGSFCILEVFSPVALNLDDTLFWSKQPASSVLLSFQPHPADVKHQNEAEAGSE